MKTLPGTLHRGLVKSCHPVTGEPKMIDASRHIFEQAITLKMLLI